MAGVVLVGLFVAFPQVDLIVQRWFWTDTDGFFLRDHPFWVGLYDLVPRITVATIVAVVALLVAGQIRKKWIGGLDRRVGAYLILTLALGPGLLVNSIFKEYWGRARPREILEFGGQLPFTPPFVRVDACDGNCSFVSGHASVGFFMVAVALLAPAGVRGPAVLIATAFGALVGLGRIVQGGHFFSDVVFSGVFTVAVAIALHRWILERGGLDRVPGMMPPWAKRDAA